MTTRYVRSRFTDSEIEQFHSNFNPMPPFSWMVHNIKTNRYIENEKCYCGTNLKYRDKGTFTKHCTKKCMNNSPKVQEKRKAGITKESIESREKFQKHKLKDLLEHYDESLTEVENMKVHGFYRVFDCGNDVWIWKRGA